MLSWTRRHSSFKVLVAFAFVLTPMLGSSSLSAQQPMFDDFSKTLDDRWLPWSYDSKKLAVHVPSGMLRVKIPGSNNSEARSTDLESPDGFSGDFDFILEFNSFSSPKPAFIRLYLYDADIPLKQKDKDVWIMLQGDDTARRYVSDGYGLKTLWASTSAKSGRLRIQRVKTTLTTYYWFNNGWKQLQPTTTSPLSNIVYLAIEFEAGTSGVFQVYCDWIQHGPKVSDRIQTSRPYAWTSKCPGGRALARNFPYLNNQNFGFHVECEKPNAPTLFLLGTKKVNIGLGSLAPRCPLLVDPDLIIMGALITDPVGTLRVPIPIPNDNRLKGGQLFAQFATLRSVAPTFTLSNGVKSLIY